MCPGHFGIGFAVKRAVPKAPLWTLLVASEALDLLSFGFIALGVEKMAVTQMDFTQGLQVLTPGIITWSHGLFMTIVWSALFAAITYPIYKDWRISSIIGLVVFSHWVLDFIVHPPDLPISFGNLPKVGLGLWTSSPGFIVSIILELALLGGGIAIYVITRKRGQI